MTFWPALRKTGVWGLVALNCVSGTPFTETLRRKPPLSNRFTKGCGRPVFPFIAQPGVTVVYDLPLAAYSSVPSALNVLPLVSGRLHMPGLTVNAYVSATFLL